MPMTNIAETIYFLGKPREDNDLHKLSPLQDNTNDQQPNRKRRLSSFFKLASTPRRKVKHRNYSIPYNPVLTAGERLEEMRIKEEKKKENENLKLMKAKERVAARIRREEIKSLKAEARKRKKYEIEMKKEEHKKKQKLEK